MQNYAWVMELENGQLARAEDAMPSLEQRASARSFVLTLPKANARLRVEIPKGARLIFIRRVADLVTSDGIGPLRTLGKSVSYLMGWQRSPIDKCVQLLHVDPHGMLTSCLIDDDGRPVHVRFVGSCNKCGGCCRQVKSGPMYDQEKQTCKYLRSDNLCEIMCRAALGAETPMTNDERQYFESNCDDYPHMMSSQPAKQLLPYLRQIGFPYPECGYKIELVEGAYEPGH